MIPFCRATLCISTAYAVFRCPSIPIRPSVRVSVTVEYSVETSEHTSRLSLKILQSGIASHAILVFPRQTLQQPSAALLPRLSNGDVECRWDRKQALLLQIGRAMLYVRQYS